MKAAGGISSAFVAGVVPTASCSADFFSAVESESLLREGGFSVDRPGGEFFSSVGPIVRRKGTVRRWVGGGKLRYDRDSWMVYIRLTLGGKGPGESAVSGNQWLVPLFWFLSRPSL